MKPKFQVQIAVVAEESYKYGLAVLLQTTLENLSQSASLTIHALDLNLSERTRAQIAVTIRKYGPEHELRFYSPQSHPQFSRLESALDSMGCRGRKFRFWFFKLLIPDLLTGIEKVLYLDTDIYVKRDVSELFQSDFQAHPLKAVSDSAVEGCSGGICPMFKLMARDDSAKYFNSGVFLMDLKYWRDQAFSSRIIELLEEFHQKGYGQNSELGMFGDQDVFNLLYINNWEKLPPEWNRQCPFGYGVFGELNDGRKLLIHYLTHPKPWSHPCNDQSRLFFESLDKTSFAGWRPTNGWIQIRYRLSWLKYKCDQYRKAIANALVGLTNKSD